MKTNTYSILFIGLLSALFFSSTFILNRYIAIDGGHWFWSATLRYIYMVLILIVGFIVLKGYDYFRNLMIDFFRNFIFWSITGSIGFGVFYALICYVSDSSPAWVVATTWQFTIIASLIVLSFFGRKIPSSIYFSILIIFTGILVVNFAFINIENLQTQVVNIFLMIIASFAYPIGNQLVWEHQNDKTSFEKVFLLSLGSFPFWIILSLFFDVGLPSSSQYTSIFVVAILSGIMATSLFLYARSKAQNSSQIALIDATQSTEVIFTLTIEMIFLSVIVPSFMMMNGILCVIVGMLLLAYLNK
jgi:drug/metabolite transporter (DMT)-like permease